jgi:hypothetical protein
MAETIKAGQLTPDGYLTMILVVFIVLILLTYRGY